MMMFFIFIIIKFRQFPLISDTNILTSSLSNLDVITVHYSYLIVHFMLVSTVMSGRNILCISCTTIPSLHLYSVLPSNSIPENIMPHMDRIRISFASISSSFHCVFDCRHQCCRECFIPEQFRGFNLHPHDYSIYRLCPCMVQLEITLV